MVAAIPGEFRTSSVAMDGTDVETRGALHGDCTTVELDSEASETHLMQEAPKKRRPVRKAPAAGRRGRRSQAVHVHPDARAGHSSATNSWPAGPDVGFELH